MSLGATANRQHERIAIDSALRPLSLVRLHAFWSSVRLCCGSLLQDQAHLRTRHRLRPSRGPFAPLIVVTGRLRRSLAASTKLPSCFCHCCCRHLMGYGRELARLLEGPDLRRVGPRVDRRYEWRMARTASSPYGRTHSQPNRAFMFDRCMDSMGAGCFNAACLVSRCWDRSRLGLS